MKTSKKRPLWFRTKTYGWGWVPVTWQGWAITLAFSFVFVVSTVAFMGWLEAAQDTKVDAWTLIFGIFQFLAVVTVLIFSLHAICIRYGEKPRWRWGEDT